MITTGSMVKRATPTRGCCKGCNVPEKVIGISTISASKWYVVEMRGKNNGTLKCPAACLEEWNTRL